MASTVELKDAAPVSDSRNEQITSTEEKLTEKPKVIEPDDKRTPDEKKFFELVEKGNNEAVIAHVKATKVKIDCLDQKGMTPLQFAAFRGNKDLCEFLLANGADVNSNHHENSYSALMFAALSGNREVTRLMLQAGANVFHINSVNRTAGQMAAFVGQHQCVSVINNFFPQSEIDYYTKPQGLEKEGKLPVSLSSSLTTLLNFSNVHPVKISMYLRDHPDIVAESERVCLVLSRLVEKTMKSREPNESLALKCHFIGTVIKMAGQAREKDADKSLKGWLKSLMKGREEDGCMELQERLVRQSLKDFPYVSSALLQQLVRQIAPMKIGDDPTAYQVISQAINGQQFSFESAQGCDTCKEPKAQAKCAKCKMVSYCNQDCQRLHWATHKKFCAKLAEHHAAMEAKRQREEEKQKKEEEEQKKEEEEQKKKMEEQKKLEEERLKETGPEEAEKAALGDPSGHCGDPPEGQKNTPASTNGDSGQGSETTFTKDQSGPVEGSSSQSPDSAENGSKKQEE